jgi:hypothetical protein
MIAIPSKNRPTPPRTVIVIDTGVSLLAPLIGD